MVYQSKDIAPERDRDKDMLHGITPVFAVKFPATSLSNEVAELCRLTDRIQEPASLAAPHIARQKLGLPCINGQNNSRFSGLSALSSACQTPKHICSMSRKGNCWNNALTESWFNSFKNERVHELRYETRAEMASISSSTNKGNLKQIYLQKESQIIGN